MGRTLAWSIEDAAKSVGRLHKRYPEDHAITDLAHRIEAIDAATFPTAAELYASFHDTEDEDDAVRDALNITDQRSNRLRRLLGLRDPLDAA